MSSLERVTLMPCVETAKYQIAKPCALSSLKVEVYESGLQAANWPSVIGRSELAMNVFQSREFLECWMRTVGAARQSRCYLVVVKDFDGRVVLYLPLTIETRLNVTILRFPDAGLSDLNAPIVASHRSLTAQEFRAVWQEIGASLPAIDAIDLQKMPAIVNGLRNPLLYLPCVPDTTRGFVVELGSLQWEVYLRPTILRLRRKLRRHMRRLKRAGPTEFVVNPSGAQFTAVIEALFSLKREQFLRTGGQDLLAVPGVEAFYRQLAAPSSPGGIGSLSALICGDSVVSAHLGFVGRERFYYIMPAYDRRFRSFAPGLTLLECLIRRCAEDGLATFDLGEGDFPYKHQWATQTIALFRHETALTMRGRVYLEARRWHRQVRNAGRQWKMQFATGRTGHERDAARS